MQIRDYFVVLLRSWPQQSEQQLQPPQATLLPPRPKPATVGGVSGGVAVAVVQLLMHGSAFVCNSFCHN